MLYAHRATNPWKLITTLMRKNLRRIWTSCSFDNYLKTSKTLKKLNGKQKTRGGREKVIKITTSIIQGIKSLI